MWLVPGPLSTTRCKAISSSSASEAFDLTRPLSASEMWRARPEDGEVACFRPSRSTLSASAAPSFAPILLFAFARAAARRTASCAAGSSASFSVTASAFAARAASVPYIRAKRAGVYRVRPALKRRDAAGSRMKRAMTTRSSSSSS